LLGASIAYRVFDGRFKSISDRLQFPSLCCEAASYINEIWGIPCSPKTLAKLFCIGGGPRARKAGRIPLYEEHDLDEWAASKLTRKVASSSEAI
jgi:hypothetical protein